MSSRSPTKRRLRIGLTGGAGSGKSVVAALFAARGAAVIDADEVGRRVVAPGEPGYADVMKSFGANVVAANGSLDRKALRAVILADPKQRDRLERILHPRILERMKRMSDTLAGPYVIFEIPLLVEKNLRDFVDRVLVVDCREETQISRLVERDGETRELAQQMLAAQVSRSARLAAADDVIENDNGIDLLAERVAELDRVYRRMKPSQAHSIPGLRLPSPAG